MDSLTMKQNEEKNDNASELCFDIIQHEYDHVFERGNKLDNKVNIALTFTGVLFVFIIDLFNIKNYFIFPLDEIHTLKLLVYFIIALSVLVLYGLAIYLLTSTLSPMKIQRFNSDILLRKNLQKKPINIVYNYVSIKYSSSINLNNIILDEQYKKYKKAINIEIIMLGLSVLLYIFKYNFL
ncbi:hypothetical protein QA584_22715 [Anaerocolumna sp. AGMB13025]|uniref:hypothetical protein n=1 Tax=Anaerocolumna sp. AGMB13025 TaxID=3039116 RepID=UPI00241FC057|nr:hypothetical protein [Anaerocolumna sp. AGMB13025]WFR56398.1 hypothetical protein QA584_22715 [Anaerocolumna sp. AGMB13025]